MRVVITGGTGFVGQQLTQLLQNRGHEVIILTRSETKREKNITYVQWLREGSTPEHHLGEVDAVVNLAGISINEGNWSPEHQKKIYDSRMQATDELLRILHSLPKKPSVLVNASAIGIYPASLDTTYTETSNAVAQDFLGKTVHDWEQKASAAKQLGIRCVFTRFGVILGKDEGALPLMVLPYKLFAGGKVGSGKQWMSWVHVTDVARAILFAIETEKLNGPVNITSPFPKRMDDFGKTIAAVVNRPHWIPAPSFMMKIVLGRKSALVLEGQRVLPEKLVAHGFEFTFPELRGALEDLLGD